MLEQISPAAIAPQNMSITIGNTEFNLLPDSGNGFTIINLSLVKHIMYNFIQAKWSEKKTTQITVFFKRHC